jgi:hypothetical protein
VVGKVNVDYLACPVDENKNRDGVYLKIPRISLKGKRCNRLLRNSPIAAIIVG